MWPNHRFTICQYLPISAMSLPSGRSQSAGCGAAEQIRGLHRIHRLVDPEPQAAARAARAARDRARQGGYGQATGRLRAGYGCAGWGLILFERI